MNDELQATAVPLEQIHELANIPADASILDYHFENGQLHIEYVENN